MHKVLLALTLVIVLLVGPGMSVMADAPQGGGGWGITDCRYSYGTAFGSGGSTTGQIAEVFSTLRSAPGAYSNTVVFSPATFNVLDQGCYGGFSWVQIEYTSGTVCDYSYDYYGYYNNYYNRNCNSGSAEGRVGWALESQIYFDGTYGPGTWLEPTFAD